MKEYFEFALEYFLILIAAVTALVGVVLAGIFFFSAAMWVFDIQVPSFEQRCLELGKELGAETRYHNSNCYIKNTYGWHKI